MYFSPWKPPGVSLRMWSVNLDESISGEYQTLGGNSGRPLEYLRSLMTGTGVPWEWLWQVWEHLGALVRTLGAPGTTWERRWQVWERWRQDSVRQRQALERRRQLWEPLESQYGSLVESSSLGTLVIALEIIATTYCSTIFKTHVFSVYCHLCIYLATHLHTVNLDWLQAVLESNSRSAWKWRSSELRATLRGCDRATLELHLEEVIERVWRCTWMPWVC